MVTSGPPEAVSGAPLDLERAIAANYDRLTPGQLRLIPSFATGASLINAILAEVSVRTHPRVSSRLREAEERWDEFGSYSVT